MEWHMDSQSNQIQTHKQQSFPFPHLQSYSQFITQLATKCRCFNPQTSIFGLFIYFIMNISYIAHSFILFEQAQAVTNPSGQFLTEPFTHMLHSNVTIIIVLLIIAKIINICLVIYQQKQINLTLLQTLFKYQRFIITSDLILTSISINFLPTALSIILFIATAVILLFSNSIRNNLFNDLDLLRPASVNFVIFVTIIQITINFANLIGQLNINVFTVWVVTATLQFGAYLQFGWRTYPHTAAKYYLLSYVSLIFSFYCTCAIFTYSNQPYTFSSFLLNFTLILSIILSLCLLNLKYNLHANLISTNLQTKYYCIDYQLHLGQNSTDIESISLIDGLISCHMKQCYKLQCFCQRQSVYHSKLNKYIDLNDFHQNRKCMIQLIVEQQYEQLIREQPKNIHHKLQYAIFQYKHFRNLSKTWSILHQIQLNGINFISMMIALKLKKEVLADSQNLGGKMNKGLQLEAIIELQNNYNEINSLMMGLLNVHTNIWQIIEEPTLDLNLLSLKTKDYFSSITDISNKFNPISKYLNHNPKYKYSYIIFNFYFKNIKLKTNWTTSNAKDIVIDRDDGSTVDSKMYQLYDPSILFLESTCFVVASKINQQLIVKNVSKYFMNIFGYEKEQIISEHVNILMPSFQRNMHDAHVIEWEEQGLCNNDETYTVKQVYGLSKDGILLPLFKYIKLYIGIDGTFQYLTMLRIETNKNGAVLTDAEFNIQGANLQFIKQSSIRSNKYQKFRMINLGYIIPQLIHKKSTNQIRTLSYIDHRDEHEYLHSHLASGSFQIQNKHQQEIMEVKIKIPAELVTDNNGFDHENDMENQKWCAEELKKLRNFIMCQDIQRVEMKAEIVVKKYTNRNHKSIYGYIIYFNFKKQEDLEQSNTLNRRKAHHNHKEDIIALMPNHQNFHQFFDSSLNINSLSLNTNQHIFFKEEEDKSAEQIVFITQLKTVVRLAFVIVLSSLIALMFFAISSWNRFNVYNNQVIVFMNFSTHPFKFAYRYYYENLNLTNITNSDDSWIPFYRKQIDQLLQNELMKQIIFNPKLNTQTTYFPYDAQTVNIKSVDQIELLYLMASCINLQVKPQFLQFLYPAYDDMLSTVVTNFQNYYMQQIDSVSTLFIVAYAVIMALTFGFYLLANYKLNCYFGFANELISILTQINDKDLQGIHKHFKTIKNYIMQVICQDQLEENSIKKTFMTMGNKTTNKVSFLLNNNDQIKQTCQNLNLNKRQKQVQPNRQENKKKTRMRIILVFLLMSLALGILTLRLLVSPKVTQLDQTTKQGLLLVKYYPTMTISLLSSIQNYYRQMQGMSVDHLKYHTTFQMMRQFSQYQYLGSTVSQQFLTIQKAVFFEDICISNQALFEQFNLTQSDCYQIGDGCFRSGLMSFLKTFIHQLQNKVFIEDNQQFIHLLTEIQIVDAFMLELIQNWQHVMQTLIQQLSELIVAIILSLVGGFIVAYISLVQYGLFENICDHYEQYRMLYESMLPNTLLNREKSIRQRLRMQYFIK